MDVLENHDDMVGAIAGQEPSFLRERGVIQGDKQVRPIGREDLLKLIKENGGSAKHLHLSGMDMRGIDLRGLHLEGMYLMGSNLEGAMAQPMIAFQGQELPTENLIDGVILDRWAKGEELPGICVTATAFSRTLFMEANLSRSDFRWANLSGLSLNGANLRAAKMSKANLSGAQLQWADISRTDLQGANLREASLEGATILDADLRYADLRDARLYGARIVTPFLVGICWGDKYVVPEEAEGSYSEAEQVYYTLKQAYENAGESKLAGEFHYREREASRKSQWQELRQDFKEVKQLLVSAWRELKGDQSGEK
jgi:uncharacterized protein YjbI with pentapeptide repeats